MLPHPGDWSHEQQLGLPFLEPSLHLPPTKPGSTPSRTPTNPWNSWPLAQTDFPSTSRSDPFWDGSWTACPGLPCPWSILVQNSASFFAPCFGQWKWCLLASAFSAGSVPIFVAAFILLSEFVMKLQYFAMCLRPCLEMSSICGRCLAPGFSMGSQEHLYRLFLWFDMIRRHLYLIMSFAGALIWSNPISWTLLLGPFWFWQRRHFTWLHLIW